MSAAELASIDGEFTAGQFLHWLVDGPVRRVIVALVVLVPVAIGIAGGFAEAEERQYEAFEPGEMVDVGPYDLGLSHFFVAEEIRQQGLDEGQQGWLGVVITVDGNSNQPERFNQDLMLYADDALTPLMIDENRDQPIPLTYLLDDGYSAPYVQADLSVDMVLLYRVDDLAGVDSEIQVTLIEGKLRISELVGRTWDQNRALGMVTVPRDDDVPEAYLVIEDDA